MVLSAILLLAPHWYGPATVNLSLPTTGNPYSPTENDVRAIFTKGGKRFERLAYFAKGQWHATLSADTGGEYVAKFLVNGKPAGSPVHLVLPPAVDGDFVKRDGLRFKLTSGKPYIPFGHNFGWQNGADRAFPVQLADMATAGLNWSRIWSCAWDGKNPFVTPEKVEKIPLDSMYEPALDRWDTIVEACEKNRIKFQFVLFHHGLFSTTTDSNWAGHPWNKANGGFLEKPADFFTDPHAKALAKAWLRYAIARWGHSTSVMAWELFNEVQWVDAVRVKPERVDDVVAWHKEMAAYVRSLDPYKHLVTSSSNENLDPRVFADMDYEQPHTYPPSVFGAILGAPKPKDRPIFFGEFGGNQPNSSPRQEAMVIRDGFWGGILGGQAGPGQYWYWDRIYRQNLYPEFARSAAILKRSGFAENPMATTSPIQVTGGVPTELVIRPGRGWASTDKFVYDLPGDAATGSLPQLSSYIQGAKGTNRAMMKEPIRMRFQATSAGSATIKVAEVSKTGGILQILVNGQVVATKEWPMGSPQNREEFSVPFKAGANELTIDNLGDDWFQLGSVSLPGVGAGVSAVCLGTNRYGLARITWSGGLGSGAKSVTLPNLMDGTYELRQFNLDSGVEKTSKVRIRSGKLASYSPIAVDEAIALFRR